MTYENTISIIDKVIERIKTERKSKGISHESIADSLNISVSAYNKIERQNTKLTLERLLQICSVLEISISTIFDLKAENVYNQSFKDSSIFHQEVKNLYQDNRELTENYIESLKEEIVFLKNLLKK